LDLKNISLCVIMSNMKTVNVRAVQHNLAKFLRAVSKGEEIQVARRKKLVAKIVPINPPPATINGQEWLAVVPRLQAIFRGRQAKGMTSDELLARDRKDRI
jgi:antitoxin (DNA-binding transcriptional repressor) of toxin-antitoxin stability system